MLLPARDFKSLVSTYFTIRASVTLRTAAVAAAVNVISGHAYWIRTSGPQLRRLLLYPTELRRAAVVVGPPRVELGTNGL